MKTMKNIITILIVFCLSMAILCGNVSAASASLKASSSKVTVGNYVSVTVSFSEKVSAAQFKLSYDTGKFDYVSTSAGTYNPGTNTYVYLNYEDISDLGSVTFAFKAKTTGSGAFNISGLVLSSNTASIGTSKVTITVEKEKTNTTTNKPNKVTNNNNKTPEPNQTPDQQEEIVNKPELESIKRELLMKIETDYTEESWKALQEAIQKAESASTGSEYDEIKAELTLEKLVVAEFEKEELFNMLIELIGKSEEKYTEETWKELQTAISTAQNAELKSEYEEVKDKLTIDTLKEKEAKENFFTNFIHGLEEQDPIFLALAGCILILVLIIVVLLILYKRAKRDPGAGARRLK